MSTIVLTLHKPGKPDRWLGPVVALRDHSGGGSLTREIKLLGFTHRQVSGKRDDGGPGHRVAGVWLVPLSRWQHDPLLRKAVQLLMAKNNGTPLREVAALQAEYLAMKRGAPALNPESAHA